jgi:hypothetical protein
MSNLAQVLSDLERLPEAEKLIRRALEGMRRLSIDDPRTLYPRTLSSISIWARVLSAQGSHSQVPLSAEHHQAHPWQQAC